MDTPLVSVIIPALNEAADIAGCIRAIGAQDHPICSIEVLLVDGDSDDGTIEEAKRAAAHFGFRDFRVFTNPRRRTSCALNVALPNAQGEIVVRVDARSRVEPHYVRTCVDVLRDRPEVGEVGGAQIATPRSDRPLDVGLARAQRNRLTSGFSRYRRSTVSAGAEHVWMGAFRAVELRAIGGWDDATALNEDFELSQRYIASGQLVWFDAVPAVRIPAAAPCSPLLARQHFYFGRVKGTWWARGRRPLARHVALLALPPAGLLAGIAISRRFGVVPAVALGAAWRWGSRRPDVPVLREGYGTGSSPSVASRRTASAGGSGPWPGSPARRPACRIATGRHTRAAAPHRVSGRSCLRLILLGVCVPAYPRIHGRGRGRESTCTTRRGGQWRSGAGT